jgi:uncharacterized circularly permuted ATP-grasp superfamily protein
MSPTQPLFSEYRPLPGAFDEVFTCDGVRPEFHRCLSSLGVSAPEKIAHWQGLAERALLHQGVTFAVSSDQRSTERIFPFCIVPRLLSAADWERIDRGLRQRITALEAFLDDVYGPGRILRTRPLLRELVESSKGFLPQLRGVRPPARVRLNISGIDLIRGPDGRFRVLEDNLRTPSGVSYVLENRLLSKRIIPGTLDGARVHGVETYPERLAATLRAAGPAEAGDYDAVVLTPGRFNSAFFEHAFLARTMGLELVEAADLFVEGERVFARTTRGPRRVNVIYRRIDDAFLDPEVFREDSLLGVRGLVRAYARGQVALVNAPGNGVADDKAIYPFVPEMIRFYLGEDAILEQVPTYLCAREGDRTHVVEHIDRMVVKAVDEAGGYGMLMGPQASASERDEFRRRILAEPRKYIAQERVELSTCPTWDGASQRLVPRRVDLRPYVLNGPDGPWVLPGGLTRVALVEGSYVVNSSQGGGSKDTWVKLPEAA